MTLASVNFESDTSHKLPGVEPTVCIISANNTHAHVLKNTLENNGFKVEVHASADDALAAILKNTYDLVISDFDYPGANYDGAELVRAIRECGTPRIERLPVIICVASLDGTVVDRLKEVKASGVLAQPVDPVRLVSMAREMLLRRGYQLAPVADIQKERSAQQALADSMMNRVPVSGESPGKSGRSPQQPVSSSKNTGSGGQGQVPSSRVQPSPPTPPTTHAAAETRQGPQQRSIQTQASELSKAQRLKQLRKSREEALTEEITPEAESLEPVLETAEASTVNEDSFPQQDAPLADLPDYVGEQIDESAPASTKSKKKKGGFFSRLFDIKTFDIVDELPPEQLTEDEEAKAIFAEMHKKRQKRSEHVFGQPAQAPPKPPQAKAPQAKPAQTKPQPRPSVQQAKEPERLKPKKPLQPPKPPNYNPMGQRPIDEQLAKLQQKDTADKNKAPGGAQKPVTQQPRPGGATSAPKRPQASQAPGTGTSAPRMQSSAPRVSAARDAVSPTATTKQNKQQVASQQGISPTPADATARRQPTNPSQPGVAPASAKMQTTGSGKPPAHGGVDPNRQAAIKAGQPGGSAQKPQPAQKTTAPPQASAAAQPTVAPGVKSDGGSGQVPPYAHQARTSVEAETAHGAEAGHPAPQQGGKHHGVDRLEDEANYLGLSYRTLWFVSVFSIAIGVAFFLGFDTIRNHAEPFMVSKLADFGKHTFWISMSSESGSLDSTTGIDNQDIQNLSKGGCQACAQITPIVFGPHRRVKAQFDNRSHMAYMDGVSESYFTVNNDAIAEGRPLTQQDIEQRIPMAVIGPDVKANLFGGESGKPVDPIGKIIRVGRLKLPVVGVLKPKDASVLLKLGSLKGYNINSRILIPYTFYQQRLGTDSVNMLQVATDDSENIDKAIAQVVQSLRTRHDRSTVFETQSTQDWMNLAMAKVKSLSIVGVSVAAVCFVLGGMAIMSIAGLSVVHRARQRKKKNKKPIPRTVITMQVFIDALIISAVGGLTGVAIGLLLNYGLSFWAEITVNMAWSMALLGLTIALLVGLISASHTAKRAGKLTSV